MSLSLSKLEDAGSINTVCSIAFSPTTPRCIVISDEGRLSLIEIGSTTGFVHSILMNCQPRRLEIVPERHIGIIHVYEGEDSVIKMINLKR